MSQFSSQHVIEERNKRLVVWVAENLELDAVKHKQLDSEMMLLFKHATENELAEFLWKKLAAKKIVADVEGAKKAIKRFHDIALGWLSDTTNDRRS